MRESPRKTVVEKLAALAASAAEFWVGVELAELPLLQLMRVARATEMVRAREARRRALSE